MKRDAILYVLELQEIFPNVAPAELNLIVKEERAHLHKVYEHKINPYSVWRVSASLALFGKSHDS